MNHMYKLGVLGNHWLVDIDFTVDIALINQTQPAMCGRSSAIEAQEVKVSLRISMRKGK
jgi:hypothetical protein